MNTLQRKLYYGVRMGLIIACALLALPEARGAKFVRVLLLAGQSNMGGTGNAADLPPEMTNQTNVWFDNATPTGSGTTNWTVLGSSGGFGPEVGCGYIVARALPHEQIAVVKDSAAATGIDYWRLAGQAGFVSLTDRIALVRQRLEAQQLAGEISGFRYAGFFWMQGEAEANAGISGPGLDYFNRITDLVQKVRLATGVSNLPVVVGRTHGGITINNQRDLINVRSNQVAFAEADPYATWVDTDDFGLQDGLHLNSPGSLWLGTRMGTAHLWLTEPNPCVQIVRAPGQQTFTADHVVRFSAVFSQPIAAFNSACVALGGTAGAATVSVWRTQAFNGTSEVYAIAAGGMTNAGTVCASVPANAAASGAHSNFPSVSEDATVVFGTAASAQDLLAYDDCEMPPGPLYLAGTGYGWRYAGWDQQGRVTQGFVMTALTPLAYSNLQLSATRASGGYIYQSSGRALDVLTALRDYHTEGDINHIGRSNDELWVSFLARREQNQSWTLALCRSGVTWVDQGRVVTVLQSGGNWALQLMGDPSNQFVSSIPATVGQTFLMVLRMKWAGDSPSNIVEWYVNPSELGGAPPATPTATLSVVTDLFKIARIHWYPGSQPANGALDEFRLGLTYAAVTPVWPTGSVPVIVTTNLPPAVAGLPYGAVLHNSNGRGRMTWTISEGALPGGLQLDDIGVISGEALTAGMAVFTVQVTDSDLQSATQELTLAVLPEPAWAGMVLAALWRVKRYNYSSHLE